MRVPFIIYTIFLSMNFTRAGAQTPKVSPMLDLRYEITIKMHTHIQQTRTKIFLTNQFIKVLRNEEAAQIGSDSTPFFVELNPSDTLTFNERIYSGTRQYYNANLCVDDGFVLELLFSKDKLAKQIILSNYYQADIGKVISFVNARIPAEYRIDYNKDELLASQKRCGEMLPEEWQ